MARVEVRNLAKKFGKVTALAGVDLEVRDGEFIVLLGPSGCGKTTLLRTVAGLETPTAGDVYIDDTCVTRFPPRVRGVAMVFQSYALYPHMTVYDNIAYPLKARKMPEEQIQQKVQEVSQMLHIERLLDRRPRALSGGERQRTALARALVREPTVFLLDEPLSNLDAKLRTSARVELKRLQMRTGITTIYVTHDQVEALSLGDRIVIMEAGRIHQVGTAEQIYSDPADTFVAAFVGSPPMNLIRRDNVVLGFRPENFQPAEAFSGEELMEFDYQVSTIEPLGFEKIVYGYVDSQHSVVSRLSTMSTFPVQEGETYRFAVPKRSILFFDRQTGKRLQG